MGCGISKIGQPEEGAVRPVSAFKRPPGRHAHANVDNPVEVSESVIGNAMKDDEDYSVNQYGRKSTASPPAAGTGLARISESVSAKNKVDAEEKDQRGIGTDNNEGGRNQVNGHNGGNHEGGGESINEEDEYRIFRPGSPSFREYVDSGSTVGYNHQGSVNANEDKNNSLEERPLHFRKAHTAGPGHGRFLNREKVHGLKSSETHGRKNRRRGLRRPGWIGRSKKST